MVILQVKGGHGSRTSKGWQSEKISKLESAKVGQGMLAILGAFALFVVGSFLTLLATF
jgi:hypothetical protein